MALKLDSEQLPFANFFDIFIAKQNIANRFSLFCPIRQLAFDIWSGRSHDLSLRFTTVLKILTKLQFILSVSLCILPTTYKYCGLLGISWKWNSGKLVIFYNLKYQDPKFKTGSNLSKYCPKGTTNPLFYLQCFY